MPENNLKEKKELVLYMGKKCHEANLKNEIT